MKLNDRQIKLITHDGKGRKNFPDGNGLYLRVTSKQKTWSLTFWNNSIKMGINENNKIHKRLVK